MDAAQSHERNGLFAVLAALTLVATLTLLATRGELLIPRWGLVAIAVPWTAFSIYLRLHRDGVGREGRVLDLWSIPHFVGGVVLGLFDVPLVFITLIVIGWELVESVCCIFEHLPNRIADIVLALAGWTLVQLAFGGSFAVA